MRVPASATGHVLSLDLSSHTGWCGGAFGSRPTYGAITLGGWRAVQRCAALRDWLDDYERLQGKVTALILEMAIITKRDTSGMIELLWGLRHTALMWAFDGDISESCTISYGSSTVRAHMLGKGDYPASVVKQHVMDWCCEHGMPTRNDNAGDAILTWKYAEALVAGTPRAPKPGGLFAKKRK